MRILHLGPMQTLATRALLFVSFGTFGFIYAQERSETPTQAVARAQNAHGKKWADGDIVDWKGQGRLFTTGDEGGPSKFTLWVKKSTMVQRIAETPSGPIRYGSDGKQGWQSGNLFVENAGGQVEFFLESQTKRSISRLLNYSSQAISLRGMGKKLQELDKGRISSEVIAAEDSEGRITRYYIDDDTSLITRIEFDTGGFYTMMMSDKKYPLFAAYVFSDYRNVDGAMTPFKIETYLGLIKIEEMQFDSVQFNTGVSDDAFKP